MKIYCAPLLFLRKLSLNRTTLTRLPNLPTEASCSLDIFHTTKQQVPRRFHFSPTKSAERIPSLWTCPLRVQLPVTKTCQQPQTRLVKPIELLWSKSPNSSLVCLNFRGIEFPTNIVSIIFENFNRY